MNKQDRREFLTVVTNDQIAERVIGMSFGEKREAWADWEDKCHRMMDQGYWLKDLPTFRTFLFDRVERKILAERDASYHEAGEPL